MAEDKNRSTGVGEDYVRKGDENRSTGVGEDYVRKGDGQKLYMADQGFSATSHGDGSPTIDEHLIEVRKADVERNADPDKVNKELANKLSK